MTTHTNAKNGTFEKNTKFKYISTDPRGILLFSSFPMFISLSSPSSVLSLPPAKRPMHTHERHKPTHRTAGRFECVLQANSEQQSISNTAGHPVCGRRSTWPQLQFLPTYMHKHSTCTATYTYSYTHMHRWYIPVVKQLARILYSTLYAMAVSPNAKRLMKPEELLRPSNQFGW